MFEVIFNYAAISYQIACDSKSGECALKKSPVLLLHFLQFISVLFIDVSNARVIYHQVGGKGDYVHHAVRSWETFFCAN